MARLSREQAVFSLNFAHTDFLQSYTILHFHRRYSAHNLVCTLTTNFRYCRLGDLNLEPATLCACAGGEQQTIIKIVIHFL